MYCTAAPLTVRARIDISQRKKKYKRESRRPAPQHASRQYCRHNLARTSRPPAEIHHALSYRKRSSSSTKFVSFPLFGQESGKRKLLRNKRLAEALGIRAALGAGAAIGGAKVCMCVWYKEASGSGSGLGLFACARSCVCACVCVVFPPRLSLDFSFL